MLIWGDPRSLNAMLHVYHSNRLEALFVLLCTLREAQPLSDPIAPETVLVANPGIGRWLNLQIADRESIAANIEYHLPATFVWQLYRDCLDDVPEQSQFDKRVLQLRLMGLLAELEHESDSLWQPLRHYLQADDAELADTKRVQLASRIADVFDQYLVYRPQRLLDWERGNDTLPPDAQTQAWQPALWRALTADVREPHRATLWRRFCEAADRGDLRTDRLPEHLHVFNVGLLPPSTLDVLVRLAKLGRDKVPEHERVSLYFLNPAVDYWADLVDMRRAARERLKLGGAAEPLADDENGNPLLASLGGSGRTLLQLLGERSDWVHDEQFYLPSESASLLATVQRDLLSPFDAVGDNSADGEAVEDTSIQIHGSYSVLRELQALHDHLVGRFNSDDTLEPADVLVMVPDINAYAPVIEAVFGSVGAFADGEETGQNRRIPWSVADQSLSHAASVVALVQRLIDLPGFEFEASQVLSLAAEPTVARRFGFDDSTLATLRLWLSETGIRRTLSGEAAGLFEAPEAAAHSWDFGLRRVLLGRAMPLDAEAVGECLPWPHVESEQFDALSRVLVFLQALNDLKQQLTSPRPVRAWVDAINVLIDRVLLPDDNEADALAQLRELIAGLESDAERAGHVAAVSHASFREMLTDTLASATQKNHRYLTGRVTFSSMVPLRSVPFRVVCLLGLNDGDFPRQRPGFGFDLIARYPEQGDRSVRDDDRYLFLEAILSARDALYLSWLYRNPSDNAAREPSVLLAEFRDYLAQRHRSVAARVVLHPLQPFSHRLYSVVSPDLQSYASEWEPPDTVPPAASLCETGQPITEKGGIPFAELARFWRNPSAWYCTRVLGLALWGEEPEPEDAEPFELDALARYGLRDALIASHSHASDHDDHARYTHLQRAGVLPHGVAGEIAFDVVNAEARTVAERIASLGAQTLDVAEIALDLQPGQLTGQLTRRVQWPDGESGVLHARATRAKGRDLTALVLAHLVGAASGLVTGQSVFVGLDKAMTLNTIDADTARERLLPWVEGWVQGHSAALPFFADTSPVLAKVLKGKADTVWAGSGRFAPPGESTNEAIAMLYPDRDQVLERDDVHHWATRLLAGVEVTS